MTVGKKWTRLQNIHEQSWRWKYGATTLIRLLLRLIIHAGHWALPFGGDKIAGEARTEVQIKTRFKTLFSMEGSPSAGDCKRF